jgi:hypothetical protein
MYLPSIPECAHSILLLLEKCSGQRKSANSSGWVIPVNEKKTWFAPNHLQQFSRET